MKDLTDLTTQCIRCGFCLESCPTFMLTGKETESPRGRIYLVRSAEEGQIGWEDARPHLDACLGCRACETACPSGVKYGEILEIARDRLEQSHRQPAKRVLVGTLANPSRLRLQLLAGGLIPGRRVPRLLSRLISGEAPEADRPKRQNAANLPPLDEATLPAVRGEVYFLEGCAMRVLYSRVNTVTRRLLRRVGYSVRETKQGCCGALHAHNGYLGEARALATGLVEALPGDLPVVVNSAGCGSAMKEYGELLGESAQGFARRVLDASEFLQKQGLAEELRMSRGLNLTATYHDACHLAHGQGVRSQPRDLLAAIPGLRLVPLPESEMCCGSAGIYNLTQPKMARALVERKYENVRSTGASVVVTGNPGCHAWIAQAAREHGAKVQVLHTLELLEAAFCGMGALQP